MTFTNNECMQLAFAEAIKAKDLNEVPVGAIVTLENKIIGRGYNSVLRDNSVASHAELNAINEASKTLKNYRLLDCDLYITLEPCHMCAKAIVDARIKNVYFATLEPKTGSVISVDNFFDKSFLNHKVDYFFGLMQEESSKLLKDFFLERR
jgi:tRNA(adenine34) deaminase